MIQRLLLHFKLLIMYSKETLPLSNPFNYSLTDQQSRKSMISKLPGHPPIDLSAHPDMVILFQAAEIQRLAATLASSRVLAKGHNKEMLDRHSYEIQVKELSAMVDQLRQQKSIISERSDLYKRKIDQLEAQKGGSKQMSTLLNKYERALLQISKMYDDNTRLQQQLNTLTLSNQNLSTQIQIQKQAKQCKKCIKNCKKIATLQQQLSHIKQAHCDDVSRLRESFDNQLLSYKSRVTQKTDYQMEQYNSQINSYKHNIEILRNQLQDKDRQIFQSQIQAKKMEVQFRELQITIRREAQTTIKRQVQEKTKKSIQEVQEKTKKSIQEVQERSRKSIQEAEERSRKSIQEAEEKSRKSIQEVEERSKKSIQSGRVEGSLSYSFSKAQGSINSSFQPESQAQKQRKEIEKLQNNVAMLSQQVQRLSSIVKEKNMQIFSLQQQISITQQSKPAKEQQILSIRLSYESELRKQSQEHMNQVQQKTMEIQRYRQRVRDMEGFAEDNRNKMEEVLVRVKNQERKVCEAVWEKKMGIVDEMIKENNREKQRQRQNHKLQIDRLQSQLQTTQKTMEQLNFEARKHRNQNQLLSIQRANAQEQLQKVSQLLRERQEAQSSLRQQIKQLQSRQLQEKEQQWSKQIKNMERIKQEEKKYDIRLREIEDGLRKDADRRVADILSKNKTEIAGMQKILQQQAQFLRSKEIESMQKLSKLAEKYEEVLKSLHIEMQTKVDSLEKIIRQKQEVIRKLQQSVQASANLQALQTSMEETISESQHKQLVRRFQQIQFSISGIVDLLQHQSKPELMEVLATLRYIVGEIGALSAQVNASVQSQMERDKERERRERETEREKESRKKGYSQEYVKQLQAQCDNYLKIILTRESTQGQGQGQDREKQIVNSIWQEIERNNRYNRQQWQQWRSVFHAQQKLVEQYYQDRQRQLQNKFQNQSLKQKLQIQKAQKKSLSDQLQKTQETISQLYKRIQTITDQNIQLSSELSHTLQLLKDKEVQLNMCTRTVEKFSEQQQAQVRTMGEIMEQKIRQIGELVRVVDLEKDKYQKVKANMVAMENQISRAAEEMRRDWDIINNLESQNKELRASIQAISKQLQKQCNEKYLILQSSQQQLQKLTQQLTLQSPSHIPSTSPTPSSTQFPECFTPLLSSFHMLHHRLHCIQHSLYSMHQITYSQTTQSHVDKQFSNYKLGELTKHIDRLVQENFQLKDEIARWKLEVVGLSDLEKRYGELLATFVIVGVEVEALRIRCRDSP